MAMTYPEQKAFYDSSWPALRDALATGGPSALVEHILAVPDPLHRRILFAFVRGSLRENLELTGGLDGLATVARAGIAEFLTQAESAPDEQSRLGRIGGANVISYNLAADLHVRPGEDTRTREQHEQGLAAAKDCLRWREMLNKPPRAFSTAWWVRGVHELALGDTDAAIHSFEQSAAFGRQVAKDAGRSEEVAASGGYFTIFASGWRGIACRQRGDVEEGQRWIDQALAAFTSQLDDEGTKEDAEYGLLQLRDALARRA